ncbi:MAG: hypothetical protein EOO61_14270 [Hymenobacter sp.]|nr:MAG: hypothetical protein EOO61_14270 [Hymenobacter sp.]
MSEPDKTPIRPPDLSDCAPEERSNDYSRNFYFQRTASETPYVLSVPLNDWALTVVHMPEDKSNFEWKPGHFHYLIEHSKEVARETDRKTIHRICSRHGWKAVIDETPA